MIEKYVIAITGPTGSGKSTVSQVLAKGFTKAANIEIDHVKHFVVSGFEHVSGDDWDFKEWKLVGECIGLLTKKFLSSGHTVIINGYMHEDAWLEVQKVITITHKFVLLPKLEIVENRDAGRSKELSMGKNAVLRHFNDFSTNPFYKEFTLIDSSEHSVEETVNLLNKYLK